MGREWRGRELLAGEEDELSKVSYLVLIRERSRFWLILVHLFSS